MRARVLCVLWLWGASASALPGPAIEGRVVDGSGTALPGVTVEAAGPVTRVAATDASGHYRLADLEPGDYRLAYRLPGFAGCDRAATGVAAGETRRVDAELKLSVTADLVVTGRRTIADLGDVAAAGGSLIGITRASSEGAVAGAQLAERPIQRPGEVLETVPGLVISQHSGDGKANQYYLRGFNLDHGTDFAASVAGMPINMPSHAHGQGYLDLNFVIPELISGVEYRKGPYSAEQGDFSAAGSASIRYADSLDQGIARAGGGEHGYARALFAQSPKVGEGTLLYALEISRDDGPWVRPENGRRWSGVLRYSRESDSGAFSLTGMGYQNRWNASDQVPARAVASGLVPRFGAIDPSDGGDTHRYSLSAEWRRSGDGSATRAAAFVIDSALDLFSNFTYVLDDPIHGDQFEQVDRRIVTGFSASHQWLSSWLGSEVESTVGVQMRNDNVAENGLFHTEQRQMLATIRRDHIAQTSASIYGETSWRCGPRFRSVIGLRADAYRFRVDGDRAENSGADGASLLSPKLSLVAGPWRETEAYANFGYGFHSNDARGATLRVDPRTGEPAERVTPLVRAKGAELGIRTGILPRVQTTVALWGLDLASELVFAGDAGSTEPARPTRRTGVELASSWSPVSRVTVDADVALSRARFRTPDPAGDRVPGSVESVVSAGVSARDFGRFSGAVRVRYFGPRPLVESGAVRSRASTVINAELGCELERAVRLSAEVFNLTDARVSDVDYFYVSRLAGEPAAGVGDVHSHPASPRTLRVAMGYAF